ncbi:gliding motility-associated-like protein [Filimonas zeae]|nr:PKD domain-containing protein [Filimonas zeae]MDR6341185.1 gliding motility-associated-like protein [Filimonas zeae]
MKRAVVILFILISGVKMAAGQMFSNRGTDFWTGMGHNSNYEISAWFPTDTPRLALMFNAERDANVIVTIEGTTYRREYPVKANSVVRTDPFPIGYRDKPASIYDVMLYTRTSDWGGTNSEGLFKNKGVHITSDVPIVAYAHFYSNASSSATMLMPTESWGYSYLGLTPRQSITVNAAQPGEISNHNRFSWMFFVAGKNDTRIRITPSVPTRNGSPAGVPIDVTLQKGEIYQMLAAEKGLGDMYDLTGTTAVSITNSEGKCVPFAGFAGSSGMGVPCTGISGTQSFATEECMMQQMFPKHAWGKRYLTAPSSVTTSPTTNNYNVFRIMVTNPATVVKRNGVVLTGITPLNYYEYRSNTADYIEADLPIQVLQIFPSQGECGYIGTGDPEMIYLSPVEQGIKKVGFFRNDRFSIDWNFLTLIVPTAGVASLTIDGKKQDFSHTYPHPYLNGYTVVVRRWNTRSNTDVRAPTQCIVESDSAFTAITYGFSDAESYGYNAGTYINNLNGFPEYKNVYNTGDTANSYTCAQTPVQLSVLMRYQPTRIEWKLSEIADKITPATDVVINSPVAEGEVQVFGVTYYRYSLPGTYQFTTSGYITVPVYTTHPTVDVCSNTEQIPYQVIVEKAQKTDFSIVYENCKTQELIGFEAAPKFTDGADVLRWEWRFMNNAVAATATGQQVKHLFDLGNHSAKLVAVDNNGCICDTTKPFSLSDKPAVPAFAASGTVCTQTGTTFTETVPQAGIKEWYWDFGEGTPVKVTENGHTQTHAYPAHAAAVTVKHVVKYSAGCISDTAYQTIPVYALPKLDVEYDEGCLPAGGRISFTSKSTVADAQTISGYSWDFGDISSTPDNPNTATVANPSHLFGANEYLITYKVTTNRGCSADTVLKAAFSPRAVLAYAALPAVCVNEKAPVSVATAAVTNGVAGTGYYRGPGVENDGKFYPAVAGVGTHTIWCIFTTSKGCADSVSTTIVVKPKPLAQFTYTGSTCAGGTITFTDASTLNGGSVTTRKWNMGDGTQAEYNTAAPFTKVYTTVKRYDVQLIAAGNNGCADTITNALQIQALPKVDFQTPAAICMPEGKAAFVNKSAPADGTALSYKWSFGDNTTSVETDPVHTYTTAGNYQVKLIAAATGGCADSITKVADQFFSQPVAGFDAATTALCQGTPAVFTNTSTAPGSTLATWAWSFGDGTVASSRNASKTYTSSGTYTVTLTVTNAKGCSSALASKVVMVYLQPIIDAGADIAAEEDELVQLKATANSTRLQFAWSPAQLVSNAAILQPTVRVKEDAVLTLTATGENNCTATDEVQILVQRPLVVPNIFTPNGDGINDTWLIKNLNMYAGAVVQLFNRYGQKVILFKGDAKPWDGTVNGTPVPGGVYYYIIQLNNGQPALTGSVTIIR